VWQQVDSAVPVEARSAGRVRVVPLCLELAAARDARDARDDMV
jgi:hypothetical protein